MYFCFSRSSLAVVSKFFRALFSHKFEDSQKTTLHLDSGGEMGLTVAAVRHLAEFAQTKQIPRMEQDSAVQVGGTRSLGRRIKTSNRQGN